MQIFFEILFFFKQLCVHLISFGIFSDPLIDHGNVFWHAREEADWTRRSEERAGEEREEGYAAAAAADWLLRINFKASSATVDASPDEGKKNEHMQHQARNSSAGEPRGATSSRRTAIMAHCLLQWGAVCKVSNSGRINLAVFRC